MKIEKPFHTKLFGKRVMKCILCFCLIFVFFYASLFLTNSRFKPINSLPAANITDQLNCTCSSVNKRSIPETIINYNSSSTCGDWATARGPHQRVLTYSIYGHDESYFNGIALNAALVAEHYPGWVMRVYYHFNSEELDFLEQLCPLWCEYPHLDFCAAEYLPSPLFNQTDLAPALWRFLVLGDPLVDRFVCCDLDSLISAREKAAVDEWIQSGKTFHFMHDHSGHIFPILGGMWGSLNTNLTLSTRLREEFLLQGKWHFYFQDQLNLATIVLPIAQQTEDYLNHDSFYCQLSFLKHSRPWPVQRNAAGDYVGSQVLRPSFSLNLPCPTQCRPPQHQDWTFC